MRGIIYVREKRIIEERGEVRDGLKVRKKGRREEEVEKGGKQSDNQPKTNSEKERDKEQ